MARAAKYTILGIACFALITVVVFVLTVTYLDESSIDVSEPPVTWQDDAEDKTYRVETLYMLGDGKLSHGESTIETSQLEALIRELQAGSQSDLKIIIKVQEDTPHKYLVEAKEALDELEINSSIRIESSK